MATIPNADVAMHTILAAAAGVTSITSTRIYPIIAPANTVLPYVTYMVISEDVLNITQRSSIDWYYRVHSWADTGQQAASLHQAVYAALHGQQLTISASWTNHSTRVFNGVRLVDDSAGNNVYHFVWDVRIQATEDSIGS